MLIQDNLSVQEKLKILTAAAKYDVSCTSSGVNRKGKAGSMGNASEMGICHSFSADGRCISLLKILFTNQCIYDCKYCINRCSNDVVRTSFTPEEICRLTMYFKAIDHIHGLHMNFTDRRNKSVIFHLLFPPVALFSYFIKKPPPLPLIFEQKEAAIIPDRNSGYSRRK